MAERQRRSEPKLASGFGGNAPHPRRGGARASGRRGWAKQAARHPFRMARSPVRPSGARSARGVGVYAFDKVEFAP